MKKIYFTLFAGLFVSQFTHAQSITQAANQPAIGDIETKKGYDSVGVVPKTTGSNQTWNFTNFTSNSTTATSSFVAPASVPSSTAYTGVTMVENLGGGNYNYWKVQSNNYEMLGSSSGTSAFNYTNSALQALWPIAPFYNNTDNYAGTVSGTFSGNLTGTVNVNGSGTGTLIIPGGTNFTNILQVKVVNTVAISITTPFPTTLNVSGTDYMYYHSSQKFPLLTVNYTNQGTGNVGKIWVNMALITGLNDKNFDATFAIFPNPAKDAFNVKLTNANNENASVAIFNAVGQVVKTISLGNASVLENNINISDLSSGIYIVKTTLGDKSSARRLIVE